MTPPDDTPPKWLRFECHEPESGKTYYTLARGVDTVFVDGVHGHPAWKTLDQWLAWRSRVAEALGLVEPGAFDKLTQRVEQATGVPFTESVVQSCRKAVAAELRRLADEYATDARRLSLDADAYLVTDPTERAVVNGRRARAFQAACETRDRLRARADELEGK